MAGGYHKLREGRKSNSPLVNDRGAVGVLGHQTKGVIVVTILDIYKYMAEQSGEPVPPKLLTDLGLDKAEAATNELLRMRHEGLHRSFAGFLVGLDLAISMLMQDGATVPEVGTYLSALLMCGAANADAGSLQKLRPFAVHDLAAMREDILAALAEMSKHESPKQEAEVWE